jgi:hypothetical protein
MRRGSTFRMVVISLLTLATLLVYAVSSQASMVSPNHSIAQNEHVVAATADKTAADHDHKKTRCADMGLLDDSVCCSMAHCLTMHAGLLAGTVEAFVPHLGMSSHLPAPAMLEGIGSSPALHPPRLII